MLFWSAICFNLRFVGDPTPYIIGTLLFITSAVSFGTMIGTRTNTQSSAVQAVATGGFTTALLLSGYLYPIRNVAFPLNWLTVIIPNRWYVQLARDSFVRGASWNYGYYLPLFLAFGALLFFNIARKNLSKMQLKV